MKFSTQQKKQLIIYGLIAFLVPYIMGLFMWYGYRKGIDTSVFPNAQMMYPAAGAILALWITKKEEDSMPLKYYVFFLLTTLIMMVTSIISVFVPSDTLWITVINFTFMISSAISWIVYFIEKKEKRIAYGLKWRNWKKSVFCIVLFVLLYLLRTVIAYAMDGQLADFAALGTNIVTWITVACLPVNFFLVYIAFFGEEYGWRYFLQPMLQARFGKRIGVIILGIVWGLWHLPVNFFFYSPGSGLASAVGQQVTCITLGIFFAYAYMKTENIWVPVILHYLNNNLVPIITGTFSADVLQNQHTSWSIILPSLLINGALFGIFLLSKEFKKESEETCKI